MSGVGESLRESRRALVEVFRNPNLRRLNLAFIGSVIGDGAYAVGVAVYAYTRGGATAVGALAVVRYVSMALLSPLTSMLADKVDRKRVMAATDAIRVVFCIAGALCIWQSSPAIIVYALAVLTSVAGTAFRPAQAALMPVLANHPGELTAANVASSTIESVGFFAGPALGGVMIALSGIGTVYAFEALTFLWSAVLVLGLRPAVHAVGSVDSVDTVNPVDTAAAEPAGESQTGMFSGVGDGYREIFRNRDVRLLIGLYCAQTVVAGASAVFGVAIALDMLDLGNGGVGLLNSVLGVGGLIGGFVALLLAARGKLARDFGLGVLLWAAPLLLVAAWPSLVSALAAMALIGLANSVVDVNAFTILQRLVPDAVMGRVFGAMESAVVAGMGLGALLMPILIHTIGLRGGLVAIGAAVSVISMLALPGLRRIDRVALSPVGLDLIRAVPMLAVLPEATLERLARLSKIVTVPAGRPVFSEGDRGDGFFVIESGSVDVTIRGDLIRTLSAGDSFGEIALLRDLPRTATITATSDLVARVIDRQQFIPAVTGHGGALDEAERVVSRFLAIR
ncbi:MAG: hypothetical protein JWN99_3041 [Ilumatobacteraceae bacterium]|nr:hypothetical protein [Ilumatobacteraceae bacterium]